MNRREALARLGLGSMVAAVACGGSTTAPDTTTSSSVSSSGGGGANSACVITPEETAGPYPDRLGMINSTAFYRQDITEGRAGIPLTLALTVVNVNGGCSAVANAAIEVWQCDASGNYSEYSQPGYNGAGQTFLRGLQTTDANGVARFRTIYPGWYAGRATHIHVQVFRNGSVVKTTQVAFPEDISATVYETGAYVSHGQNSTRNAIDNVFSDGTQYEMAIVTGNTSSGYTATLTIGLPG